MTNWADDLISEYKEGRKELNAMHRNLGDSDLDTLDKSKINSMVGSMTYSIDWMETGRQPGLFRGVDKRDAYRAKQYEEMDVIPDITQHLKQEREPLYMDQQQRKDLFTLFKNFSERERQCFVMYEAEQLSMGEIANRLEISKGTVQMYIKRARNKVEEIAS